jgi:hypothetical protein
MAIAEVPTNHTHILAGKSNGTWTRHIPFVESFSSSALLILRYQKTQVRYAKWMLNGYLTMYKRNLAMQWTHTVVNKVL